MKVFLRSRVLFTPKCGPNLSMFAAIWGRNDALIPTSAQKVYRLQIRYSTEIDYLDLFRNSMTLQNPSFSAALFYFILFYNKADLFWPKLTAVLCDTPS